MTKHVFATIIFVAQKKLAFMVSFTASRFSSVYNLSFTLCMCLVIYGKQPFFNDMPTKNICIIFLSYPVVYFRLSSKNLRGVLFSNRITFNAHKNKTRLKFALFLCAVKVCRLFTSQLHSKNILFLRYQITPNNQ